MERNMQNKERNMQNMYIWNPDTLDELGHTHSYSVHTVFIPSMTMPYDEHCMYLVILAIVSTSLYIPVHTDRCQKSKVQTVYVQNAKFYTEMYTVCTFTMFCTYIVCTLYVHCSYIVRTVFVQCSYGECSEMSLYIQASSFSEPFESCLY